MCDFEQKTQRWLRALASASANVARLEAVVVGVWRRRRRRLLVLCCASQKMEIEPLSAAIFAFFRGLLPEASKKH